jgi:hypothetical protein
MDCREQALSATVAIRLESVRAPNRLARVWRTVAHDVPDYQTHDGDARRKDQTPEIKGRDRGMFDEAVKPSPRRPAQSGHGDTEARVVATKVYQFADNEAQDSSAHQPAGNANQHKSPFRNKYRSIAAVAAMVGARKARSHSGLNRSRHGTNQSWAQPNMACQQSRKEPAAFGQKVKQGRGRADSQVEILARA